MIREFLEKIVETYGHPHERPAQNSPWARVPVPIRTNAREGA
jgi:hypothetical protein